MHVKCPLSEVNYISVFEFLDLASLFEVLLTSRRFGNELIKKRIYYSTLFTSRVAQTQARTLGIVAAVADGDFASFSVLRNAVVDIVQSLRKVCSSRGAEGAGARSIHDICAIVDAIVDSDGGDEEQQQQKCEKRQQRVDFVLAVLSQIIDEVSGQHKGEGVKGGNLLGVVRVSTCQSFDKTPLRKFLLGNVGMMVTTRGTWSAVWALEGTVIHVTAHARSKTIASEWETLMTNAAAASVGEGTHAIEPGLVLVASLQVGGYNKTLVEDALGRCAMYIFRTFCPDLITVETCKFESLTDSTLRSCRTCISSLNRLKVVAALSRYLFQQSSPVHNAEAEAEAEVEGLGERLLLRGAVSDNEYYSLSCSFVDRVVEQKFGIPLTLCGILCMAAARVGMEGLCLLNLPGHVKCGLCLRPEEERGGTTLSDTVFLRTNEMNCVVTIDCHGGGRIEPLVQPLVAPSPGHLWTRAINNMRNVCSIYVSSPQAISLTTNSSTVYHPLELARRTETARSLAGLLGVDNSLSTLVEGDVGWY